MNEPTLNNPSEANIQTQSTERTHCCHGNLLTETCLYCVHEGVYFERDRTAYEDIAKRDRNISFDLAFELYERINRWQQASKEVSLKEYFKKVKNGADFDWSVQSLKQAYYVAKEFPDLKEKKNGRRKFSIYREIASARLTKEQRQEIIQKAEQEKLKVSEVRKLRKQYQGEREDLNKSRTIVFHSREEFIEKVSRFIAERADIIKEGSKITITVKSKGEAK